MPKRSGDFTPKPSAFVLAPEAPYPVIGGGPLRTASIIEYLRARYDVHIVTFREPGAPDPRQFFPEDTTAEVIDLPFHSKTPASRALRNLRRVARGTPPLVDRFAGFEQELTSALEARQFDLGIVEHFWCAPYAAILRPFCKRLILDLHNIESVLLSTSAAVERGPAAALLRRFARSCRDLERVWLPCFDAVLVASEADRDRIGRPAIVYPNTIPLIAQPARAKRHQIVFSGNLEYAPNQAAIRWFHSRVWPEVSRTCPRLTWRLVGKNGGGIRERLGSDPRITLSGPVTDAVAELAESEVAVVPVVSGSGTRLKIIEAWAAGLPVISTTLGAEGLPCRSGVHLLIADVPASFASAIVRLLGSEDLRTRLASAGRRLYEERLTWNAAWSTLYASGI